MIIEHGGVRMDNPNIHEVGSIRLRQLDVAGKSLPEPFPPTGLHNITGITDPCLETSGADLLKDSAGKVAEQPSTYQFSVLDTETGAVLGMVRIGRLFSAHPAAWLSINLMEDARSPERAGAIIGQALRVAFIDLGFHRVCVNLPSYRETEIAWYEEAGFLRETQRRQAVCHDDRLYDDLIYGILRYEWQKKQQEVGA